MSENATSKTVGVDGLVEFGKYLTTLSNAQFRDYTFEIPDETGRLVRCSLEDVLLRFRKFFEGKEDKFRACVAYTDSQHGTIGRSDRTFSRNKQ